MSSEDLFEEDFSEEIISELDQDYVDNNVLEASEVAEAQEKISHINSNGHTTKTTLATTNGTAAQSQPISNGSGVKTTATASKINADQESKLFQLPLTRIRNIMKLDPDLHIASNEAVFAVTRATELFIESVAREAYSYTAQSKKKTVQKRDVELAISAVDCLMFLDGAINF